MNNLELSDYELWCLRQAIDQAEKRIKNSEILDTLQKIKEKTIEAQS